MDGNVLISFDNFYKSKTPGRESTVELKIFTQPLNFE